MLRTTLRSVWLAVWFPAALGAPLAHAPVLQPSDECLPGTHLSTEPLARCFAMRHEAHLRTLWVYVPAQHSRPLPVILVLHGAGGSGAGMERLTRYGFDRIADRDGVLVVYPDGIHRLWNDGRSGGVAARSDVDDLGFLEALPAALAQHYPIDVARVYATGISNGGLMSYRLACDASTVFAAVAPVAANFPVELAARCHPTRPVSVAVINGTEDPLMPWDGGSIRVLNFTRGQVLSTFATLARWAELDHCAPLQAEGPASAAGDGTSLQRYAARCPGDTAVRLYELRGGGHSWPQGEPYLARWLVGPVSQALDANEAIWEFFRGQVQTRSPE